MNHPSREEWMSYLYDDVNADTRAQLAAHRAACPDCAARVAGWETAQHHLDAWQLPARRAKIISLPAPALRWAAAAVLLLGLGFGLGRLGSATQAEHVRAALEPQLRQELRGEFSQLLRKELARAASDTLNAAGEQAKGLLADYDAALDSQQAEMLDDIYGAVDRVDAQRAADCLTLKKELDTVAVNTDSSLRRLVQLTVAAK